MRTTRDRYQQGSIRRVSRSKGFAWEFRYYVTEAGQRKLRCQTFDSKLYPTEKSVRQKVEAQLLKLNDGTEYARSADVTFGALLDRYVEEEMPTRKSTRDSYLSLIRTHLRPKWKNQNLTEIKPAAIHAWFQSLKLASVTKGHVRALMHKLFDLATLWEYLPLERRNPLEFVKIKNVTRRTKERIVLSPAQFRQVVKHLPAHVNMIAVTAACLGLRVSEALGLKWSDIDWIKKTITIQRSAYRGAIEETKTVTSKAKLPMDPVLARLLTAWKTTAETEWLFSNPLTELPLHAPNLQQRWIRPAGEALGLIGLGFHALRHSYRSWLDTAGASPGVTKDLMRHAAISTTFDVYGMALSPEKREANSKVVRMLFPANARKAAV